MGHGVLLLDKPIGLTSNQALSRLKRLFSCKKVGHTGCLDPLATGLLPICFGDATKFAHMGLSANKTYETTLHLGVTTTTGDREGEIVERLPVEVTIEKIHAVLKAHEGQLWQVPPMMSALKHQGQPLYALARKGITIERQPRLIQVSECRYEGIEGHLLKIRASVSKGTYIRTLGEDIGKALGCGAHLQALRRVSVAGFSEHQMITLEKLETLSLEERWAQVLPLDIWVNNWPIIVCTPEQERYFITGRGLTLETQAPNQDYRFYNAEGLFIGVGHLDDQHQLTQRRGVSYLQNL